MTNETKCATCDGTKAVARGGGFDACPTCQPKCEGCGKEIDPDTCGCGDPIKGHGFGDGGHPPIPLGCDCFRSKEK